MVIDWRIGVRYAKLHNEYSSDIARLGRWHKIGSFYVAIVAGGLDFIVQMMAKHGMGFNLPWKGAVLLPAVMVGICFRRPDPSLKTARSWARTCRTG